MDMRSDLGRVRGFGSTNDGMHHWKLQRVTGIALVPLTIWFIYVAIAMAGADLAEFKAWLSAGANPVFMSLLIFTMFHHAQLGIQVVVEDYIQGELTKFVLVLLTQFTAIVIGGYSIYAVMRLTFGD